PIRGYRGQGTRRATRAGAPRRGGAARRMTLAPGGQRLLGCVTVRPPERPGSAAGSWRSDQAEAGEMIEGAHQVPAGQLMQEMELDEQELEQRKQWLDFHDADVEQLAELNRVAP